MKILMVCLGNICRSPLAEGILQKMAKEKGLDWEVDSAGTSGWHSDDKPDPRSRAVALQNGLDISHQRSRKFSTYDFERFDIIYAMDAANYQDIIAQAQSEEEKAKVKMILNESQPGMNAQVPDPYFGDHGFIGVYNMLNEACLKIIENYA